MNTLMWEHPFTRKHLSALCDLGVRVVDPVSKKLACGDVGQLHCWCMNVRVLSIVDAM